MYEMRHDEVWQRLISFAEACQGYISHILMYIDVQGAYVDDLSAADIKAM